jgi:hypothetical protein
MFDKKDSKEGGARSNVIDMTSHKRRQKARASTPASSLKRGSAKRAGGQGKIPAKLRIAMGLQLLILCVGVFWVFRGCVGH